MSNDERGRSAGRGAVARLLSAIEYPESLPGGNGPFTLRVDGAAVHAEEFDGRLVLSRFLSDDESLPSTLRRTIGIDNGVFVAVQSIHTLTTH